MLQNRKQVCLALQIAESMKYILCKEWLKVTVSLTSTFGSISWSESL